MHPLPGRNVGTSIVAAWNELRSAVRKYTLSVSNNYQPQALDFHLCRFDLSSARGRANGCVVNARLITPSALPRIPAGDPQVICKVVDFLRYPDDARSLAGEAHTYAVLRVLQGKVIPTLYGYYDVWGILRFLALQFVGNAIPDGVQIDQRLCDKMKAVLRHIHRAGFVHGDIARRNFCGMAGGTVFLVDLERCRRHGGNLSAMEDEMNEIDIL